MDFTIKNEELCVRVAEKGAELQSIMDKDGVEYLWQGDEATWPDRALNIFPYVARLTEKTYTFQGKTYHMEPHGFVPYRNLQVAEQKEDLLVMELKADDETRIQYPFEFTYRIYYKLNGKTLEVTFEVENQDDKAMYFGIGGHPGFIAPLEENCRFDDFYLEFVSDKEQPFQVGMSEDCFVTGNDVPFALEDGKKLLMRHDMFDNDAIILRNMAKEVTLKSDKSNRGVRVSFPQMDYLGIWHWPKTEVDYICIEPWSSLPARKNVIEDLEKQENLVCLPKGETYRNTWTIEIL